MMTLKAIFESILIKYPQVRQKASISGPELIWPLMVQAQDFFNKHPMVANQSALWLVPSIGRAKPAETPWLALIDRRESDSIMDGIYMAYVFHAEMKGFYLMLAQGSRQFRIK